ncbi:putative cyclic pyranopterin monophosphate synthase accessory protein [uncultured Desulfobacterium sp.]|uniref:Putative cyclic pyranopterin monophosphate synthase accessory protein n=1 Tax=uncultured Desulfobacterium sp. TaxID=201089 RepID=A0A445N2Z7_9BACT|nr:putative cyclic pyranopterin monophosphate synthase accessory protein [uncultured Desulfobacterium sp.]
MGMVDVTEKPVIKRQAEAGGRIYLSPDTIRKIKQGQIKKGDPFLVAEVAAMNASKQTHLLIPHCHQIPLDMVQVTFDVSEVCIEARCIARTHGRTGVEMEALVGVSIALNTIWDMVKYLEKDENGQYPSTRITDIIVIGKEKG